MLGKAAVGIVLSILLIYGFIEARPLLLGPSLQITSPTNYLTAPGGIVTVTGTALRFTSLSLNGAPLLADEKGVFSSTLVFPRGTSILTLTAGDRFGRTITTTRTIYVP